MRWLIKRGEWLVGRMITAHPTLPIRLDAHADDLSIHIGQEMCRRQPAFIRQPWFAFEQQRLMMREPFGAHEKIGERRMRLISAHVGEGDFECGYQLNVDDLIA